MISIIVAVSENGVIGCNNALVWNLKDDLKRFKDITSNHTIIVGRKTFEALPFVLPNRKHIVITNNKNYNFEHKDVSITNDLHSLLQKLKNEKEEYFVIGGGTIYEQALPYTNKIYLTEILESFEGDTFFHFDKAKYTKTYESNIIYNNNIPFKYINYNIKE